MIQLAVLGLGMAALALVGVALVEALARRAELGAGLLLAMTVLNAAMVGRVPAATLPGGIRVQVHDAAFALLLAAAVLRLLRTPRFSPFQRWALLLGGVLLVSLVRGVLAFGVERSVAEFRLYLAFVSGVLYFASFPPSAWLNHRIGSLWLAFTVPMLALVVLRWLDNLAGIDLGVPPEEFGADAALRVLNGPYAFFVAVSALLTVPFWRLSDRRARRLTWLGTLLLLAVLLLDRRTVWLALLVGVGVLLLRRRRLRRRELAVVLGAALLTIGVYAAFARSDTEEPLTRSAVSTGTLDWRVEGWRSLLEGWSGQPGYWLVGQPFGSGFTRTVEGAEQESGPHNLYLTTLLRSGVAGLGALVALTVGLLAVLWRVPATEEGLLGAGLFPALLAMQAVWCFTWLPGMEQGIVTGLAVALAADRASGRRPFPALGRWPVAVAGAPGGPPEEVG
jgi:O-Antigen ligase